jgi:hypothetical protein
MTGLRPGWYSSIAPRRPGAIGIPRVMLRNIWVVGSWGWRMMLRNIWVVGSWGWRMMLRVGCWVCCSSGFQMSGSPRVGLCS